MRQVIEIASLVPKVDAAGTFKPGIMMSFKRNDGRLEQFDLSASHMEIMQMLGIQNLSEACGLKYEMETDSGGKLVSMKKVDTREITYADIERIQKGIDAIQSRMANWEKAQK